MTWFSSLSRDDLLDLLQHGRQIEMLLPETRRDERRLVIRRNEEPANAVGRVYLGPHELEVFRSLGKMRIGERNDLDAGGRREGRLGPRVCDRKHLLAVHARDVLQQIDRDAVDLLEGLRIVEDRSVGRLHHDHQLIGCTEHRAILRVELDVGMARRVEIEEVRGHRHVEPHEVDEEDRNDADQEGDLPFVAEEEEQVRLDDVSREHLAVAPL